MHTLHDSLLTVTLSGHLLVRHDVLHDHVFVFFADRMIELLLVVADQLLDVHVVLLKVYVVIACCDHVWTSISW